MTTRDLIVIGAGFWGMSIFRRALERDLDALLVDACCDFRSSRAATGIVNTARFAPNSSVRHRFPEDWTEEAILAELDWLVDHADLARHPYIVDRNGKRSERSDLYFLPDDSPLFSTDNLPSESLRLGGEVTELQRTDDVWHLHLRNARPLHTNRVIVAAGVWTNDLLPASIPDLEMRCIVGRGFIFRPNADHELPADQPIDLPVSAPPPAPGEPPVTSVIARPQYGAWRLGSSWEIVDSPQEATSLPPLADTDYGRALLDTLDTFAPNYELLDTVAGIRPLTPKVVLDTFDDGLTVATGGGRVGLGLAPIASLHALRHLDSED